MKKLICLSILLVAGVSAVLALTSTQFNNASTAGYSSSGAIGVSNSPVTSLNNKKCSGCGTISFQTGPVSWSAGCLAIVSGFGSISWFSVTGIPDSSATNLTVSSMVVTSKSTGGKGSTCKYQMNATFSGINSGGNFSGSAQQLITVKLNSSNQVTGVQGNGGSITVTQ